MTLADLLAPDRVILGVEATTVREAVQPLVDAIVASGRATDPDAFETFFVQSLPREAVTVGGQAFLLHIRTDAVSALTVALGVTAAPVHREHDPGREARILALVTAPARDASLYLRAVGAFARVLAREDVAEGLLNASGPEEVLALDALVTTELPEELLVRDVLPAGRLAVRADTSLGDAAELMMRHGAPAVPVIQESGEVLGIVTYRELLQHFLPRYTRRLSGEFGAGGGKKKAPPDAEPSALPVRDAMDRSVLCISEDQPLSDAASLLVNKNLDRVPVVREGVLVGMLTREEIVRRLFGP